MRVVLPVGLLIIFISTFFMIFIYSSIASGYSFCDLSEGKKYFGCSESSQRILSLAGIMMVMAFVLVDAGAVYLMIISWTPS